MKLLLDTHVLIWAIENPDKINETARTLMVDNTNELFVSYFSLLEIKLKDLKGNLYYPPNMSHLLDKIGISVIPPDATILSKLQVFNPNNKDPFDNLIIITAIQHQLVLLTDDAEVLSTKTTGLQTIGAGQS
jgi:PIN domain nuclease of toxin-antitoxin system